jgi:pterin-4a-carbinolamine dehydratase
MAAARKLTDAEVAAGGISQKDFDLATAIDDLLETP